MVITASHCSGRRWLHPKSSRLRGCSGTKASLGWKISAAVTRGADRTFVRWRATTISRSAICGLAPTLSTRDFAVLGHVYTAPAHRCKGLARVLLETALSHSDAQLNRLLVLGVDNPVAASLYLQTGFQDLTEPDAHGHKLMIRGDGARDLLARHWPAKGGTVHRAPLGAEWYASAILLTNVFPGEAKLPSLGIISGHDAELRLLEVMQRTGMDGEAVEVLVDDATGCIVGIEHLTQSGHVGYAVPGWKHE